MLSGHTDTITCCNYNPSGQVCIDCCLMIVVVNQWIVGQHGETMEIENTWIELFLQSTRVGFELDLNWIELWHRHQWHEGGVVCLDIHPTVFDFTISVVW